MNTSVNPTGARWSALGLAIASIVLVAGCANMKMPGSSSSSDSSSTDAKPAADAPKGVPPGMNAAGVVIDPAKVEEGHGQKVKGLNDWEGEILGKPVGKFGALKIGMSMRQVTDIVGQPSDQGGYMTGKAWIPWYFGSDRHRFEMVYKGQGRLIFAGGSLGDYSGGNLIWIINSAAEDGYR